MGEKMEYAVASAAASATIKTVKTVNWIRARKAARLIFSVALAMTVICAFTVVAFATNAPSTSSDGGGEKVAESMITEIKKWVGIIAGVVIVFGAVNAGLGVANQDEAGRNRGFMTMAGGAIMEAVVQLV
ncbi:MAG: hypothetical protein ACLSHR_06820 [Oscillospiraceae bacterium]